MGLFKRKSLFDSGARSYPGIERYRFRAAIPEEERCLSCTGLGVIRWRYSMTGEDDWHVCFDCNGSGKRAKK